MQVVVLQPIRVVFYNMQWNIYVSQAHGKSQVKIVLQAARQWTTRYEVSVEM